MPIIPVVQPPKSTPYEEVEAALKAVDQVIAVKQAKCDAAEQQLDETVALYTRKLLEKGRGKGLRDPEVVEFAIAQLTAAAAARPPEGAIRFGVVLGMRLGIEVTEQRFTDRAATSP